MMLPDPAENPTLTAAEVAPLFGISTDQLYKLVREGKWVTPVQRLGRALRFPTQPILDTLNPPRTPGLTWRQVGTGTTTTDPDKLKELHTFITTINKNQGTL